MQHTIIDGNGASVRPGQFSRICFQPDGGDPATPPETKPEATPAAPAAPAPNPELEKLKKENERLTKFEAEALKASKEAEKAKLDEVGRAKADAAEAKADAIAARKEAAATKHGLPEAVAELLKGETREEIDAHASTLAAIFPAKAKTPANTGTPAVNPDPAAAKAGSLAELQGELKAAKEARDPLKVLRLLTKISQLEAAGK
jgi:hypothetical protein